jgi:hypothetical protein
MYGSIPDHDHYGEQDQVACGADQRGGFVEAWFLGEIQVESVLYVVDFSSS